MLIKDAQKNAKIRGIKISPQLSLTHLLFVDDVIMFGYGTFEEWVAFKIILDTFCDAFGMQINMDKSCFLYNELDVDLLNRIFGFPPYKFEQINKGFNYLGYFIKTLGYLVKDWHWILTKFANRIQHWTFCLLSIGGRLVLIKAVLTSLSVYWMELVSVPQSILDKLRSMIFSFLWGSSMKNKKIPSCSLAYSVLPDLSGWMGYKAIVLVQPFFAA